MKTIITSFCLSILGYFAFSQPADTLKNNPKEDVKVNKTYDENGNLTSYDSVYTYHWSGDSLSGKFNVNRRVQKHFSQHIYSPTDSLMQEGHLPDEFKNKKSFFNDSNSIVNADSMIEELRNILGDYNTKTPGSIEKYFDMHSHFDFDHFFNDFDLGSMDSFSSGDSSNLFSDEDFFIKMRELMKKHLKEMNSFHEDQKSIPK